MTYCEWTSHCIFSEKLVNIFVSFIFHFFSSVCPINLHFYFVNMSLLEAAAQLVAIGHCNRDLMSLGIHSCELYSSF